jgi:signal transduction histidine kinase
MDRHDDIGEHRVISEVLGLLNERLEVTPLLEKSVGLLKGSLKCEAVGIRVMDNMGNINYCAHSGFTESFLAKEGPLCIRHDRCACIEITKGEYDPSAPFYTPYGSFYTNGLQDLEPVKEGMKRGRFRGECVRSGWESLALVPIRFAHRYFGLIHVVDKEKGSFPPDRVRFLENVAAPLGLYMHSLETQAEREREFSSLIRRVMHDLRSPLVSTKLFSELIADKYSEHLDPEVSDFIARISRNADYMDRLIADLNSFALAYDSGHADKKEVDLCSFVPALVKDQYPPENSDAKIIVPNDLPKVKYSPLGLRRLLTNLINNAVKYSGGVKPSTVEIACQEKETFFQLSVSDNGMGIAPSEVDRVFDPFYRSDDVKDIPGTGLGLSICRKIVERHGGKMWAFSDKGKGSTFYFTVPK